MSKLNRIPIKKKKKKHEGKTPKRPATTSSWDRRWALQSQWHRRVVELREHEDRLFAQRRAPGSPGAVGPEPHPLWGLWAPPHSPRTCPPAPQPLNVTPTMKSEAPKSYRLTSGLHCVASPGGAERRTQPSQRDLVFPTAPTGDRPREDQAVPAQEFQPVQEAK